MIQTYSVAQWDACPTGDQKVDAFSPRLVRQHFLDIDHEIFSTVHLEGQFSVSGKRRYIHVLVSRLRD